MTTAAPPYFTDAEVDDMCDGLTQDAAKIRFLRDVLHLRVDRKPNGRPLAWRPAGKPSEPGEPMQNGPSEAASVVVGLRSWHANRKSRNGQETQGR